MYINTNIHTYSYIYTHTYIHTSHTARGRRPKGARNGGGAHFQRLPAVCRGASPWAPACNGCAHVRAQSERIVGLFFPSFFVGFFFLCVLCHFTGFARLVWGWSQGSPSFRSQRLRWFVICLFVLSLFCGERDSTNRQYTNHSDLCIVYLQSDLCIVYLYCLFWVICVLSLLSDLCIVYLQIRVICVLCICIVSFLWGRCLC